MKRICVFCGSSSGINMIYHDQTRKLGRLLAELDIELIYGGGNVGLMGILADSVLHSGGKCTGVMPKNIQQLEIAHEGLTKLYIVDSMHERKQKMAGMADAFIALPGGFGTLDELSEVLTYNQLRIFDKPIGILNVNGFFNGFLSFLDHCVAENFVRGEHRNSIFVSDDPVKLINLLEHFEPVRIGKWIDDIRRESTNN